MAAKGGEGGSLDRRGTALGYVACVALIDGILIALEWERIGPETPLEFAYLSLLTLALVPLAILLVSTAVYLAVRARPLPRATLREAPRVAVLYTAYNDALLEAIRLTLRDLDYPNAELWLISDSNRPEALALEQTLPDAVRIFRRPVRRGGKAGAINDWLRENGGGIPYAVPMDADSILRPGSLRTMVEIAEHPANAHYAGFQSLMEVHPALAPTTFARVMGRGVKYGCRIVPLANQRLFGQGMYWGSNALLRTAALQAAGGWVEGNICEDFALTARLDASGFPVALVDVYNYEGFPPDVLSLRERTARWCQANISVAPSVFRQPTGFAVRLNIAIPLIFYGMAPTLLLLLLLNLMAPLDPSPRLTTALGGSLLAFVFFHRVAVIRRSPRALWAFLTSTFAETVVILGMSLRVTWALLEASFREPRWVPSRKEPLHLPWSRTLRASAPELCFGGFLAALVAGLHPPIASAAMASVWVVSFLATPLVLWASGRGGTSP